MKMARLAVLIETEAARKRRSEGIDVFTGYTLEILAHAGLPFQLICHSDEISRGNFDAVIICLTMEGNRTDTYILDFVRQGGIVISYGGLPNLAQNFGCVQNRLSMPGYADVSDICGQSRKLRFLQADPWRTCENQSIKAEAIGNIVTGKNQWPLLLHFEVGNGCFDRWAVNIPEIIVRLQQGAAPVVKDGQPAPDGTAAINDGILKADDGMTMDWGIDREKTTAGTPYFAYPYADMWREALVTHLLKRIVQNGMTLPFLGYWPDGISSVAIISHDSDLNSDESARTTQNLLKECRIHSTWCMLEPGYSPSIYEAIKADGHEIAFHYNGLDCEWSEKEFCRQFQWLTSATGQKEIISNKNHYFRFEGWGELFRWCENCGIESDQTRGPSKEGNIGFLFGTCHPYFPIAGLDENNRIYDVLEIGPLTQDLGLKTYGDDSMIAPFLEQIKKMEGVAHFLFHQIHIHNHQSVRESFRKLVKQAKCRGFQFWTGKQINDWERVRRKVEIVGVNPSGFPILRSAETLGEAVVWVPIPEPDKKHFGKEDIQKRFGIDCLKKVVSIEKGVIRYVR